MKCTDTDLVSLNESNSLYVPSTVNRLTITSLGNVLHPPTPAGNAVIFPAHITYLASPPVCFVKYSSECNTLSVLLSQ